MIGFGNRMKIIDIEALKNGTTTRDGSTVPSLEVRVVPGPDSSPDKLCYIYNITNMTETTMTLKLGFENPIEVSADDIDSLKVTFNDISYFQGTSGETIKEGTEISRQIPAQMIDSKMAFMLA